MTDYQKAVQDHMATAPVELREYVCAKMTNDSWWYKGGNPICTCGFEWRESKEGVEFWSAIDVKKWPKAMATDFWQSREEQDPLTLISEMEIGQVFTFGTGRWKIVSVENGQAQCERLPDVITLPITQQVPAE